MQANPPPGNLSCKAYSRAPSNETSNDDQWSSKLKNRIIQSAMPSVTTHAQSEAPQGYVLKQLGCELKLLPLKFAHIKYEGKYREQVAQSSRSRVPFVGCLHAIMLIVYWILQSTSPTLTPGNSFLASEPGAEEILAIMARMVGPAFHTGMAINMACDVWMMIMWFASCGSREYTTYCLLLVQIISSFTFLTFIGVNPIPEMNTIDESLALESAILSHEIVVWVYLSVLVLLTVPVITMHAIMPCRTCITWIIIGVFGIAVFGTFHLTLARFRTYTSHRTSIALSISNFLMGLFAFGGRYQRELQERIDFWSHLRNQLRLKVLHHEVQRLSPAKDNKVQGESTVEEVTALLRHSQKLVAQVTRSTMVPDLIRAEEILKEVLRVLSHGGNLFQVRFSNLPEEGESIIDQYIWGKSFVRSVSNNTLEETMALDSSRRNRKPMKTCREAMDVIKRKRDDRTPTPLRMNLPKQGGSQGPLSSPTLVDLEDLATDKMSGLVGVDWNLNILEFVKERPDILVHFGAYLLLPYGDFLKAPPERILKFLAELQDHYLQNPYHNAAHAAMVAHTAACVIKYMDIERGSAFSEMTHIVYLVASLGHDVGHPSRNNQFFVTIFDPLAVIYNDKAVLENYHAFTTFQISQYDGCDIFRDVLLEPYREIRRRIIDAILATDMKEHFDTMGKFRHRRGAHDWNVMTNSEDLWMLIRFIIKVADLSHACVVWDQHFEWSCRIQEEFYQQGEEEEVMGYTKSSLCERRNHAGFASSQKGFLELLVLPMILDIVVINDTCQIEKILLAQLHKNIDHWSKLEADGTYIDFPAHITAFSTILNTENDPAQRNHSRTSSAILADQMFAPVAFHRLRSSMRTSSHPDHSIKSASGSRRRTPEPRQEEDTTHIIAVQDERARRNVRWQPR